ncbi:MAG: DUF72 domain-containing protein [Bacteroidetes bacterium]|nr:MAG: DUF72 domain-containing protein [Bacteroidota bacterium]
MEFGKVSAEQLPQVVFDLPALPAHTQRLLASQQAPEKPVVYVGCPVWANKEWIGSWYPADTKEKDFLHQYAQQFNTIELNSTHYQIPHPSVVEHWRSKVPDDFRFCPKFLQDISHTLLQMGEARAMTQLFCQTMQAFGECLGTSFLQLSPYFSPKERDMLLKFCDDLPVGYRLAVEFRQAQWFVGDNLPKISEELASRGIGTVITDTAGRRDAVHLSLSSPTLMLRFVGNDLHTTDYTRIDAWVGKLQSLIAQGVQEIYFFAHEPDNTKAPDLACYVIEKLAQVCNIHLKMPKRWGNGAKQVGLF